MTDKDNNVFMAKLSEQAERYEGKGRVSLSSTGFFGC